ncbi:unnamed protein product [Echinostoma caproni]|uniref:Uma2 domain-containing protein n=1 Tax=Echinostoma caproni TaxID=27848 RepID=A0A183AJH6_9TREM|nr:unnamed protein product [Echinostoma caproni]
MPESEHRLVLNRVRRFCSEILPPQLVEREDMQFRFTEGRTRLVDEDIYLQTPESRISGRPLTVDREHTSAVHSPSDTATARGLDLSDTSNLDSSPISGIDREWPRLVPVEDPVRLEQFALSDALALSGKFEVSF